jgi:hypothetical protein
MPSRPVPVIVIAVLHLVFGGLGLMIDLCGAAMIVAGNPFASLQPRGAPSTELQRRIQNMEQEVAAAIPGYRLSQVANLTVDFALDGMLIAAGIGLLKMMTWARLLSIVYACTSIVHKLISVVLSYVVVLPLMENWLRSLPAQTPQEQVFINTMSASMWLSGIMVLAYAIYPVAVLIVMFLPAVSAAFRPGGAGGEAIQPARS